MLEAQIQEVVSRSAVYKTLSLGFSLPAAKVLDFIKNRLSPGFEEAAKFLPCGCELKDAVAPLREALDELNGIEGEYHRLFTTGLVCSPYESEHDAMKGIRKGQQLADILGFYQAFGFRSSERLKEFPDHIAVELEFMSLLLLKEVYARLHASQEQVDLCADAEKKFLQDHLGVWVFDFCCQLERDAESRFYPALSRLLGLFLGFEHQHLHLDVVRNQKPQRSDPCTSDPCTDEEFSCPVLPAHPDP